MGDKPYINDNAGEEEEPVEGEDAGTSTPYQLFGAFCFCCAITVAFVCILSSALLVNNMSSGDLRWLFGVLFGVFIGFLAACLCCTYYLGGSKDAWENPSSSQKIRLHFSNVVALGGLVVEFVQICSFSFNRSVQFADSDAILKLHYVAVPVEFGPNFEPVFWIFFVVAFSPYIFVLVVRIIIYVYTAKYGEEQSQFFVDNYQDKIYSVLWFLVNTLYFPVIGTMVYGLDCTFGSSDNTSSDSSTSNPDAITLDANPNYLCFEGKHIAFAVCAMLALVVYYPAASFAQAQTQSISDIKFKPKVVFIMLQGKFLMACIATFFTGRANIYYTTVLVIDVCFLLLNVFGQPCLVRWVNRMRTVFFSFCTWSAIANLIWYQKYTSSNTIQEHTGPLVLLFVGWGVILMALPIGFYLWDKYGPKSAADAGNQ